MFVFKKFFFLDEIFALWLKNLWKALMFSILSQRLTIMSLGFQVNLLIDNEAEKDYLYDVLRMYHQ